MKRRPLPNGARAAVVLAAVFVLTASLTLPGRADTGSQLASAQAKLNKLISQIEAATKAKDALQVQLNALAKQMSAMQVQIEQVATQIAQTQHDIDVTLTQIQAQQGVLDQRARLVYEAGPASTLEFLLSSQSMGDLSDRLQIVDAAAASDEDIIQQLQDLENGLNAKQQTLQSQQAVFAGRQKKLQSAQNKLQTQWNQQNAIVTQLATDRQKAESLVAKLKKKQAAELAAAFGGSSGPAIGGVFVTCPVRGPHAYSDDFGAPRYTTNPPHPHGGNDIFAPRGTPVVAPFDGTAVNGSGGLGGLAVNVYGALGYVYNAHLDRIGTLGPVTAGTVIGWVGNTGDAAGGATHDHFEFHPSVIPPHPWKSPYGYRVVGTGIDPYPYLNSVC
ncbi:MAG TPA: peptidoglycan DD-metalloendopeptidase family protein [Actinomycetota bacterium]